jgi:hypothetical protein
MAEADDDADPDPEGELDEVLHPINVAIEKTPSVTRARPSFDMQERRTTSRPSRKGPCSIGRAARRHQWILAPARPAA